MNLDEIRELIKIVTETGVAELEVQRGDNRVRIRRVLRGPAHNYLAMAAEAAPAMNNIPAAVAAASPAAPETTPAAPAAAPEAVDPLHDPNLTMVKSPIVGTFYESPSPGSPPFVRVGDSVKPGDVLCIIESMKLMNEIEAESAGTIVAQFTQNATPVEYGEALFALRPA